MFRHFRFLLVVLLGLALLPTIPGSQFAPRHADAATGTFSGGSVGLGPGAGHPYPSMINVTGHPGTVIHVNVTLTRLRYFNPIAVRGCAWDQLDILLVGPDGRSSILMSDVPRDGNGQDYQRNLVIDDFAIFDLPSTGLYNDGTYHPTDYEPGDVFPLPAPAGPHAANLGAFIGGPANGTWSLFMVSETPQLDNCSGAIDDWTLQISDGASFTNSRAIEIPDSGESRPYPSEITVSGMTGKVKRVTVLFNGVNHQGLADVDILLVSPSGVAALVLSDAGGSPNPDEPYAVIGIADAAQRSMGQNSMTQSGWFQSRNWPGGDDAFPAPAPPTPNSVGLFPLIGADPNGIWSLYVVDDSPTGDGVISDGWSLNVEIDAIPPVTTSSLSPRPNGAGWINADTTVTVSATDPGGSGTFRITFSASGAMTIAENTFPNSSFQLGIGVEGVTTLRYFATDQSGNVEATKQRVIRVDKTAPSVTAPAQTLATTSPSTGVKVRLSWSGSDATSGVARYVLQQSLDGGPFSAVTLSAATATSATLTLPSGTYRFRTRAVDRAGNASLFVVGPTFQVVAAEESRICSASVTANCLSYTGTWNPVPVDGAHGGAVRATGVAGRKATFRFAGNGISWGATAGPDRGKAEVWLDGVQQATIDLYAPSPRRTVAYVNNTLSSGSHILEIRVLGTKRAASSGTTVDVDVFCVLRRLS